MNVAVLFGGVNAERPVSLLSGVNVVRALEGGNNCILAIDTATGVILRNELDSLDWRAREALVETSPSDPVQGGDSATVGLEAVEQLCRQIDVCFLALHGHGGECGTTQEFLEKRGIPYVGSTSNGSALAFDEHKAKQVVDRAGLRTPAWQLVQTPGLPRIEADVIVKPRRQGSSIGVHFVPRGGEINVALNAALQFDDAALVEAFIPGQDVTVGILEDQALHPIIISNESDVFS